MTPRSDPVEVAGRRAVTLLGSAAVVAALLWLISGITTVEPGQRVVIARWGVPRTVVPAGLVLAWPAPIDTLIRLPALERPQTTEVTRLALPPASATPAPAGPPQVQPTRLGGCLTGDAGLVHLTGSVIWTIEDPLAFATAQRGEPERIRRAIERTFTAAVTAACARRGVDGVLVASGDERGGAAQDREVLRTEVARDLDRRLRILATGLRIERVDLVAELPEAARPAFAQVLAAAQGAERDLAEARAVAERVRQEAGQAAATRAARAQAVATELLSQARVATDSIAALAQEQDPQARLLLRQRLWRERSESILRRLQVTLVNGAPQPWIAP